MQQEVDHFQEESGLNWHQDFRILRAIEEFHQLLQQFKDLRGV